MSEVTSRIIYDLLQYRRSPPESTNVFANWKHDADLCPRLQQKIEATYSAIEKYQSITYDIQGPRDAGTDVVLREPMGDSYEYVCFQIKSNDDLLNKDYLKILKSQWFDTEKLYQTRLRDYYIVLCASVVSLNPKTGTFATDKTAKGKIRTISGEFNLARNVHVIEPEFALTFLRLGLTQIDAVVKKRFSEGDIVQREAQELVSDLTPTETAIIILIIWNKIQFNRPFVTIEEIRNSDSIQAVYEEVPDLEREGFFFDEEDLDELTAARDREYYEKLLQPRNLDFDSRLMSDLEYLEGERLELNHTDGYAVDLKDVQPLAVTMMDGSIRFEYEGKALLQYVMNVIRDPI